MQSFNNKRHLPSDEAPHALQPLTGVALNYQLPDWEGLSYWGNSTDVDEG
jgi:hypothetical protein